MADEKKGAKERISSAKKRQNQNERRRVANKAFRSTVSTAVKALKGASAEKDAVKEKAMLSSVFSLMDKGVKKGIYKQNKAARVKSRLVKQAKKA